MDKLNTYPKINDINGKAKILKNELELYLGFVWSDIDYLCASGQDIEEELNHAKEIEIFINQLKRMFSDELVDGN